MAWFSFLLQESTFALILFILLAELLNAIPPEQCGVPSLIPTGLLFTSELEKYIHFHWIPPVARTESCLKLAGMFIINQILILKIFTTSHLSFLPTRGV